MDDSFSNLLFEITLDETWKFILAAVGFFTPPEIKTDRFPITVKSPQQATVIKFDTKKNNCTYFITSDDSYPNEILWSGDTDGPLSLQDLQQCRPAFIVKTPTSVIFYVQTTLVAANTPGHTTMQHFTPLLYFLAMAGKVFFFFSSSGDNSCFEHLGCHQGDWSVANNVCRGST